MAEKNKNPTPRDIEALSRDNQLNSPLLRLPAELRNRIYHFTFDTNEVVLGPPGYWDPPDFCSPRATSYPLGLAQACTQCNYEAIPYFWKTTVFRLGYLSEAFKFTNQALLNQIQIIRIGKGDVMLFATLFPGDLWLSSEANATILVLGAADITYEGLPVDPALIYYGQAMLDTVLLCNTKGDGNQVSKNVLAEE
ncbi:hypothetical protein AA0118_g11914 [Alternaria tenuissima]|nr:hypothetical protein AA0118_g11914 [Alternaria tenuissima]